MISTAATVESSARWTTASRSFVFETVALHRFVADAAADVPDNVGVFEAPDFAASLRRFVHEYKGARQRSVRLAPDVFSFYARLLVDPRLPRRARPVVTSVLAYFVVPDDVLPEAELGPFGLMDDLYAATYAFRRLRREVPASLLADAWSGDIPLSDAMATVYSEARRALGKRTKDVLKMAGLG